MNRFFNNILIWSAGACLLILGGCGLESSPKEDAVSKKEALAQVMKLNRESCPFVVRRGDQVDLIVEWRIDEPDWHPVLAQARMEAANRLYISMDGDAHIAHMYEEILQLKWEGGKPAYGNVDAGLTWSASTVYQYEEITDDGMMYLYRFEPNELKQPVCDVLRSAGWGFDFVRSKAGL